MSEKTAEEKYALYHFFSSNTDEVINSCPKQFWVDALLQMIEIRQFETRAESAYLQGQIGGFFHSYIGQEAIQTAAIMALGKDQWWITSYRCHALALLLGATPNEIMAELYGRIDGNAKGRGGSMHLYTDKMMGGFGIVTGQLPIAAGAAFSIQYLDEKNKVAVCFIGDGAVAQGAFHEALNLASLWNLPLIVVIENNQWGMGTSVERAICVKRLAEDIAPGYNMKGYTFYGMDLFNCYAGFKHVYQEVINTKRPVLIEAVCERFKGHSISDPALYRTKDQLQKSIERDPIVFATNELIKKGIIKEEQIAQMEKSAKEKMVSAMKFAEKSPWPDPVTLEEDVYAPK